MKLVSLLLLKYIYLSILLSYSSVRCYFGGEDSSQELGQCIEKCKVQHDENTNLNARETLLVRGKRNEKSKELFTPTICSKGKSLCSENEFCDFGNTTGENGRCECKKGFERIGRACKSIDTKSSNASYHSLSANPENIIFITTEDTKNGNMRKSSNVSKSVPTYLLSTSTISSVKSTTKPIEKLVVNVNNKTIMLTEGSSKYTGWVSLSAYAIKESNSKLKFAWSLLSKPETKEEGIVKDANTPTISLSNLVAGVYVFQLTVDGNNSHGETVGSISVLPAKIANEAPKAIIDQPNQIVNLPNSGIILDGSKSTDDKKISSYQWSLLMAPLGYKLKETTSPTLQMTDLVPGNYSVMLKVIDEEGLESMANTSIAVNKETDYPPTSNAGGDKIIFLPQTAITLNGNTSTDDHGIVEWEWTKGPEDSGKAVDMQDTRTPFLRLSKLEIGHYHFILKVMDTNKQSSSSSVHVYVQSESDNVLKANAGVNQTVVIPRTFVVLNGSNSTGWSPQTKVTWKLLSGPSEVKFSPNTATLLTNVTGLTKGNYCFSLLLVSSANEGKNSSSNVTVSVTQGKNAAPKADAGGDFSVILPTSVVVVNGSRSTDDIGIVEWRWTRDQNSLAAGVVIKNSDTSPILLLTDVVPGQYIWNLTVWDDQRAASSDIVSIIVKEGPNRLDEVELVVGMNIGLLTSGQLEIFMQKLQILLNNSTSNVVTLSLLRIRGDSIGREVSLRVIGKLGRNEVMKGTSLAEQLIEKTSSSYKNNILNIPLMKIHTVVCQNNCSGHGECVQSTRECRCQSWWMESFFRRRFTDGVPNCEWSVIYVFVGVFVISISMIIFLCVLRRSYVISFWRKGKRKMRNKTQYTKLENNGRNRSLSRVQQVSLMDSDTTDSETEVETVFEKSKFRNGILKLNKIRT